MNRRRSPRHRNSTASDVVEIDSEKAAIEFECSPQDRGPASASPLDVPWEVRIHPTLKLPPLVRLYRISALPASTLAGIPLQSSTKDPRQH